MAVAGIFLSFIFFLFSTDTSLGGSRGGKIYVAKSDKVVKEKKKKRVRRGVRYPVRVNSPSAGEYLKIESMLRDIHE